MTARQPVSDPVDQQYHRGVQEDLKPLDRCVRPATGGPPKGGQDGRDARHLIDDGVRSRLLVDTGEVDLRDVNEVVRTRLPLLDQLKGPRV